MEYISAATTLSSVASRISSLFSSNQPSREREGVHAKTETIAHRHHQSSVTEETNTCEAKGKRKIVVRKRLLKSGSMTIGCHSDCMWKRRRAKEAVAVTSAEPNESSDINTPLHRIRSDLWEKEEDHLPSTSSGLEQSPMKYSLVNFEDAEGDSYAHVQLVSDSPEKVGVDLAQFLLRYKLAEEIPVEPTTLRPDSRVPRKWAKTVGTIATEYVSSCASNCWLGHSGNGDDYDPSAAAVYRVVVCDSQILVGSGGDSPEPVIDFLESRNELLVRKRRRTGP